MAVTNIKTSFARNLNPFTGLKVNKTTRKQVNLVDVSKLTISNDPLPASRSMPDHKYDGIFSKLKHGQCIVCEAGEAGKIGHALNTFLRRTNATGKVKTAQRYDDGKGRVWLLAEGAK